MSKSNPTNYGGILRARLEKANTPTAQPALPASQRPDRLSNWADTARPTVGGVGMRVAGAEVSRRETNEHSADSGLKGAALAEAQVRAMYRSPK